MLLARGARRDFKNSRGLTARSVAAEKGHMQAVEAIDSYLTEPVDKNSDALLDRPEGKSHRALFSNGEHKRKLLDVVWRKLGSK